MRLAVDRCQMFLASLWLAGAGIFFGILVVQTQMGHFAGQEKVAWAWALPTVMPTLLLIVGVLVAEAGGAKRPRTVESYLFWLAFGLSAVYILLILFPVFLQPFAARDPVELLQTSNYWLGPLQGLVSASLGAFFAKRA